MIESFNFLNTGQIKSIQEIQKIVNTFDDNKWNEFLERKKTKGIAADKTDTIPLIYDHKLINPVKHKDFNTFEEFIEEVLKNIESAFGQCIAKQAMLTRLHSGISIPRHKDRGPITAKTHRIHVAILTNEKCIFTVENESVNMKPGEVWAIDNVGKYHSVSNMGKTHRVHLIVDVCPIGLG